MMVMGLLTIVIQVSILGFVLSDYDIKTVDVDVPWEESSQGCTDMGYEILDPTVVPMAELKSQGVLQQGESYWTSKYKSKSPFFWKLGCYGVTDRSSLNETDFGNTNSIYGCSKKCGNLRYIGLEGTKCYCFPASAKLSQESKTPCTTVCPGNSNEICGEAGSDKMTVYRMLNEPEDLRASLQDTPGDCVSLNKEDLEKLYDYDYDYEHQLFTNQICTEKRTFFCRNYQYDPNDLGSEIFIFKTENMTWYDAQRHCISTGNDVAYIDESNARGVLTKDYIPVGSESWIGLFRTTKELSTAEGDVSINPTSCHAIVLNGNVLQESYNQCMDKLKTLCMKEIPTTEAPSSELPTTEMPTTDLPTREWPTTEAPTTEMPTTDLLTSEMPTTEAPSTEMSTSEAPTTEMQTTELPTTEVLTTTERFTTEQQTTEKLTTETWTTEAATTELLTTEISKTEPPITVTTEGTTVVTNASVVLPESGDVKYDSSTPKESTTVTTDPPKPNVANVAQKNTGGEEESNGGITNSGLLFILIALAVILIISIILVALAYKRYRRNRNYQKINLMVVRPYPNTGNGAVVPETQIPPSPVKTPTPKKPARTSFKQDKVLLDISQGHFVSQSDQFVPGTRDDVSWNLPFIDASRETLDNIDETQPVIVRRTILLSENEANSLNLGHPDASVDLDDKVSQSHSDQETDASEREPILKNNDEDEDDIFDDNIEPRLPRSPSEHIDLLFRMSLSGEKDQ
ncbi:uncharacterized protein [Argopecten irradians]|uniref:uncharacterized protein n=1 Tax=Argopecten irradians TaxID=31199 RepID=UPI0037216157